MSIAANIKKISIIKFFSDFFLLAPIILPFFKSNGLGASQFFIVQSIFAFGVLTLEIPSGYFADVYGRKKSLFYGYIFIFLGISTYACSSSFVMFCISELIISIGYSLTSGADSALLYDSLLEINKVTEYEKQQGHVAFLTRIGTAVSSVLGGIIAALGLRVVFIVNALVFLVNVFLSHKLVEPTRVTFAKPRPGKDMFNVLFFCIKNKKIRIYSMLNALMTVTGVLGIWSYFLYFESVKVSIVMFGVLSFLFQLGCGIGSKYSIQIENKIGKNKMMLLYYLLGIIFLLLGFIKSQYLIPAIFINALLWGISVPKMLNEINSQTSSEQRATVISVGSMFSRLLYVMFGPFLGYIIDSSSLSGGFISLGIFYLLFLTVLLRAARSIE